MIWLRMTSALKGMNISRILKIFKEMWQRHWKLLNNSSTKMFPTVAASLGYVHSCSRGVLRRWSL